MKLKKTSDKLDLKKVSIYEVIVKEFGDKIPIMKDLMKSQKSTKFSFRGFDAVGELAAKIAAKSKKFNNISEVNRAAHYIGMFLIHSMIMGKNANYKDKSVYDRMYELGKVEEKYQVLSGFIEISDRLIKLSHDDMISEEYLLEKIENVILELPENSHKIAEKKFIELYQGGGSKSKVLFKKIAGRPSLKVVKKG